MTNDSDLDLPVSAREGDVEVTKSFDADRFPVPAITFVISSGADDPIRFRLVDEIPDSFSMEGVGFHPDFESDNWTAYRDHRVEYVRTLDPGEEVETVYGIRVDDLDRVEEFVQPPTVTLLDEDDDGGDAADGVLGRDTTRAVRDALSGEQGLAGLDEEPILEGDDAPAPRSVDPEAMPAVTRGDAEAQATVAGEEAADEEPAEAADSTADDADSTADSTADDADSTADASGETDPEPATELDGVAAALADEIRAENVDDDDLALLREELDVGAPKSVDVRIGRLQSQIEDLLAYREALAEFLDDHGTADELLEEVRSDLDSVESRLADVDASLSAAATERTDLREDVTDVHDAVEDVESRINELDAEMGEVREDVADLDGRLVDVEEDVRDELDEIRDELDDLREFRDRLSNAFGTE